MEEKLCVTSKLIFSKYCNYLTREAQVFEETSQSLIEVCQLGHAVFALTALLIMFERVKVLCGHGALVFAHILPIGKQLREMTPRKRKVCMTIPKEKQLALLSSCVCERFVPLVKVLGDKQVQEA